MTGKHNPFDEYVDQLVQSMQSIARDVDRQSEGVRPFDSRPLQPNQSLLLYDNPAAHPALKEPDPSTGLPRDRDPSTGMPLTNGQASEALYRTWGVEKYIAWVEENDRYEQKRDRSSDLSHSASRSKEASPYE